MTRKGVSLQPSNLFNEEYQIEMDASLKQRVKDFNKFRTSLSTIDRYIYALCEVDREKRVPFYIGRGVGDRCLRHLTETKDSPKVATIKKFLKNNRLGIDILRHGIKTDAIAKIIEATCIDLLGIGELSNKVRGSGSGMGRATIEEIHHLKGKAGKPVEVEEQHQGLAFLLNSTYKSGMSEIELFEATRGVWSNVPTDKSIKYAYATYGGLIKEVYEIHSWVEAGTQQYFTRSFEGRDISKRSEFVGKKASLDVREKYIGKVIKKERSYGSPFVHVGRVSPPKKSIK